MLKENPVLYEYLKTRRFSNKTGKHFGYEPQRGMSFGPNKTIEEMKTSFAVADSYRTHFISYLFSKYLSYLRKFVNLWPHSLKYIWHTGIVVFVVIALIHSYSCTLCCCRRFTCSICSFSRYTSCKTKGFWLGFWLNINLTLCNQHTGMMLMITLGFLHKLHM